ncbi:CRAL-TRIO domain-containing protein [Aspergillus novofumigatus IBT 16806]|uniref:CRAL/TRIO domain protein n=1 Tax=Aspergillus novofumigatus (strain IBT 16806) TaxID=1392255 RepID=A0A2I1BYT5_ASPN1|nr:CRAL/TRIO domain protein [Aspergillus novofumigatus IBT 16806]PKX90537.1 CRAL/TRIO domain protein [Aspergillus novofumigatus IBT 16806]
MVPDPSNIPPGFLGNLSREQERCLQQLWSLVLYLEDAASFKDLEQLFRVNSVERNKTNSISSFARRNSLLTRTDSILLRRSSTASFPAPSNPLVQSLRSIGMTASEIRSVAKSLTYLSPDDVRWGILTASKHEYPDRWMLRYLRFCKWNVSKAFILLLNALQWRIKDMHVDDRLLPEGELCAILQSQAPSNAAEAQLSRGFLSQLQMGKCYVHGVDRLNRPLCVVRVRLHRPEDQSEEVMNRYITHIMESVRLLIVPPVETATVIFDMTGFSLANMEYAPVKFIIRCFELYYPESLGVLLIHNAPRIFAGIWKIIKNWIDPDMVTKIHFTKSVEDLAQFIHPSQIVSELGGDEDWEYEYTEPEMDENDLMEDDEARDALLAERQHISEAFLSLTSQWIEATRHDCSEEVAIVQSRRLKVMAQLRVNYWKLDPFVRARNFLDRTGVIQEGGRIKHYPETKPEVQIETAKVLEVAHVDRARVKLINV